MKLQTAGFLYKSTRAFLQNPREYRFSEYFPIGNPVELVHKPWTTGASVHGGPASIAGWWSSPEPGLWLLRSSRLTAKGWGTGSGAWGSRLGPHRRVSGDEAAGRRGGAAMVEGARWGRASV
jgi:hypothetical protein